MLWLKRGKFIFLSLIFLFFSSCEQKTNHQESQELKKQEELNHSIQHFFELSQEKWRDSVLQEMNEIGYRLSELMDSVEFLPYQNDFLPTSFIFYAPQRIFFQTFFDSPFLEAETQLKEYHVWRKTNNGKKILDISLEPHPVLKWTLNIYQRKQE